MSEEISFFFFLFFSLILACFPEKRLNTFSSYFNSMITVRTQIKDILKDSKLGIGSISNDFMDKLDEKVQQMVLDAAKRAKENGRRTVMGKDL